MKKGIKKALCGIFLTAFAACMTSALGAASIPETATAKAATNAGLMTSSYDVVGTSVRVVNGDYSANALRYHTQMTPAELKNYAQTDAEGNILLSDAGTVLLKDGVTTGVLLIPTYYLGTTDQGEVNELRADATYMRSVANVSTTVNWTPRASESGDVEYYEANVVLTGIPQSNHSNTVSARAYVKNGDEYEYTDQRDTASMTNVAYAVYNDEASEFYQDQELRAAYLDKKIRFYKNGGGYEETIVTYGEKIPEKVLDGNEFQGWHDKNMEHFHFSETTVTGNLKLYAIYEQNVETAGINGSSIDVSAYTMNGYEIADIVLNDPTLGAVSLGSDPNNLSLPDGVAFGDGRIAVTFTNGKTIDMPSTIVTKMIRTPEDLLELQALDEGKTQAGTSQAVVIEGYYKLASDISLLNETRGLIFSNNYYESNWSSAFKGTLDGAGYKIEMASTYLGFFCDTNGALIKDVVFEDWWYTGGANNSMLGRSLQNSTLNNVDFVIKHAKDGYSEEAGNNIGFITTQKCWNNTFIDVVIRSEVDNLHLISLFGGSSAATEGFVNNTFENCFVQVHSLNEVGVSQSKGNVLVDNIVEEQGAGSLTYQGDTCETHEFTRLVQMTYEDKIVCNKCGAVSTYYDKTVLVADRYINVTESNTLDLNGIGEYTSIKSIHLDEEEFEVSLDNLTVPEAIRNDVMMHGAQTLSVVVAGADGYDHKISVPVILVTKEFTSLSDLLSTVRYTTDYENGKIYGYYTLGADLVQGNESITSAKYNWSGSTAEDAYCGFYGTLDGRGHSITLTTSGQFNCGIFGTTYDATIKNLTITNTKFDGGWGKTILAHTMYGTRLENVTLNITGGNGTNETTNGALISGALAGAPSGAVSRWINVQINSSVNVGHLIAGLADSTKFYGCTFNGLSYKAISGEKTEVEGLTINASLGECVHTNAWVTTDASVDRLTCTACGEVAQEFDKVVDVKDRNVILTDLNAALDLAGISDGTVVSISDGKYSYGANANALTFSEEMKSDTQNHGAKVLTVTIATDDGFEHTVTVPVTLITAEFTDFVTFVETVRPSETTEDVYGYYVLGANLTDTEYSTDALKSGAFRGTLDGRNYSIKTNTQNYMYGIFGVLDGATIQNLSIETTSYGTVGTNASSYSYFNGVLAYSMANTKLTDVTITVNSQLENPPTDGRGMLATNGASNNTFTGVDIVVNGSMSYLFKGYGASQFTDCTLTVNGGTYQNMAMVWNTETLYGAPSGLTINGIQASIVYPEALGNATLKLNETPITTRTFVPVDGVLTVTPIAGYNVVSAVVTESVLGDGSTETSSVSLTESNGVYTYTVEANVNVVITITTEKIVHTVTATVDGEQAVTQTVNHGDDANLVINVPASTILKHEDGTLALDNSKSAIEAEYTYTVENVTANQTVAFTTWYAVTWGDVTGATISVTNVSNGQGVAYGTSISITVKALEGYRLDTVTIGGSSQESVSKDHMGSSTFTYTVEGATSISATAVKVYKVTWSGNNCSVKVGDTAITNGGYVDDGTELTISATTMYSITAVTITKGSNTAQNSNGKYTYVVVDETEMTITTEGPCVTADTLVTLADGTQKEIQYVTYDDQLLVWDFYKGEYTAVSSSIIMNHGYAENTVLTLTFDDGTVVNTINGHGFFDKDENEFVILNVNNVEDYVGHSFVKESIAEEVKLVSYSVRVEYTESWSILTVKYYNCMLAGMLTITPAEVEGSAKYLMPFELTEDMKYDEAKMQADIEKYGLYTYEELAEYVTYEQFLAFDLANFKVAVGKGYITWEEILCLIGIHCGS